MRFLSHLVFAAVVCFGVSAHGMSLKEMWTIANKYNQSTLGEGVAVVENDSLQVPAQIYITPQKSWIEYSPAYKKMFSVDQFDFILYHELGHLYLDHQRKYDQAEEEKPGSGLPLRRAFVLESDQFATLIYLKFGKNWDEVEKLITMMLERNTQGDWIPAAKERESAIREARTFFFNLPEFKN
jgi:hypothetical protein